MLIFPSNKNVIFPNTNFCLEFLCGVTSDTGNGISFHCRKWDLNKKIQSVKSQISQRIREKIKEFLLHSLNKEQPKKQNMCHYAHKYKMKENVYILMKFMFKSKWNETRNKWTKKCSLIRIFISIVNNFWFTQHKAVNIVGFIFLSILFINKNITM